MRIDKDMNAELIEMKNCPVCFSNRIKDVLSITEKSEYFGGRRIYIKCLDCTHIFLKFVPTDLELLYPTDYQPHHKQNLHPWWMAVKKKISRIGFFRWLVFREWGDNFLLSKKEGSFLDFGCGSGGYLLRKKDFFPNWEFWGLDASPEAMKVAEKSGLRVVCGPIEKTILKNKTFDVIRLSDVIEHLKYPVEDIKKLKKYFKERGHLLIRTPNARGFGFIIFNKYWYGIDESHIHLFTDLSLVTLLRKAGFVNLKIKKYSSSAMIIRSLRKKYGWPQKDYLWLSLLLKLILTPLGWLGIGENVIIDAQ